MGHQDTQLIDESRIPRKKRLEMKGFGALDNEVDPFGGNIDTPNVINELIDLDDDDAPTEGRRLNQCRRLLRIGPSVEIALLVRFRGHKADNVGP